MLYSLYLAVHSINAQLTRSIEVELLLAADGADGLTEARSNFRIAPISIISSCRLQFSAIRYNYWRDSCTSEKVLSTVVVLQCKICAASTSSTRYYCNLD